MFIAAKKIKKEKDVQPTEFDKCNLQSLRKNTNQELKYDLKDLFINSSVHNQIDAAGNRKAVVIHVAYILWKAYRKIHVKLDSSRSWTKIQWQGFLDPTERNNTEYMLDTFTSVYCKLAGKDVVFEYPVTEA